MGLFPGETTLAMRSQALETSKVQVRLASDQSSVTASAAWQSCLESCRGQALLIINFALGILLTRPTLVASEGAALCCRIAGRRPAVRYRERAGSLSIPDTTGPSLRDPLWQGQLQFN
jgi:hypothetical protein